MKPSNLVVVLAIVLVIGQIGCLPAFWPHPSQLALNASAARVAISPCNVRYIIQSPILAQLMQIIDFYQINVFKCKQHKSSAFALNIDVTASTINLPLSTKQDAYSLVVRENGRWELTAEEYTGFLRGFQTFSQLFQTDQNGESFVQGLPITIDDSPEFKWRGILIDSSRHFLPIAAIKNQIDSLMYNKMNILHWHIIDQQSFPLQVPEVPQLSQYGSLRGTYSPNQIQQINKYAKTRGVRVIVEIDTPAHTQSWGRSEKYKSIVVNCTDPFEGQFDPTLNQTYELVTKVMNYTSQTFEDPYIHFGGDEVEQQCWDSKPSIKQWMETKGIMNYEDLSIYYRQKQKQIFRKISSKKVIYWANEEINLPLQSDDVLHWCGLTQNLQAIANKPNEVILSNYHDTYLDLGYGGLYGDDYGTYSTWRNLYKFQPSYPNVNVIGGQVCMWGELANLRNWNQKIWVRGSVLAERLWNSKIDMKSGIQDIARRLVGHSRRMRARGVKTSVVSVQLCEENVEICF